MIKALAASKPWNQLHPTVVAAVDGRRRRGRLASYYSIRAFLFFCRYATSGDLCFVLYHPAVAGVVIRAGG